MRKSVRRSLRNLLEAIWKTEVIGQEECPMMLRWTLLLVGPRENPWLKFLIHYFPPNVSDRDPHDHPRSFVTFILRGAYFNTEWERYGTAEDHIVAPTIELVEVGAVRLRPAEHTHIVETGSVGAWTFVIMGPMKRAWGFLRDGRWWPYKLYDRRFGGVMRCDTD